MKEMNLARAGAVMLVTSLASSCASTISSRDMRELGSPEIIYLQPSTNLADDQSSGGAAYTALYLLGGGIALAGSVVGTAQKNVGQREVFAADGEEIKSLGFDDRIHGIFVSAIDDASWLRGKTVQTLPGTEDMDAYTRNSNADSVIYMKPTFSITSFGHTFEVEVVVEVQQYVRNGAYSHLMTLYKRDYDFKHDLALKKPGMTWDEQKDAGHQTAQLNPEEASRLWLENDGERVQADFAKDIPQIEAGVRQLLGDRSKAPGG